MVSSETGRKYISEKIDFLQFSKQAVATCHPIRIFVVLGTGFFKFMYNSYRKNGTVIQSGIAV